MKNLNLALSFQTKLFFFLSTQTKNIFNWVKLSLQLLKSESCRISIVATQSEQSKNNNTLLHEALVTFYKPKDPQFKVHLVKIIYFSLYGGPLFACDIIVYIVHAPVLPRLWASSRVTAQPVPLIVGPPASPFWDKVNPVRLSSSNEKTKPLK